MHAVAHDCLGETIIFEVWRPGTESEHTHPTLTLVGSEGFQMFLEALAHGNTLFRDKEFHITASQNGEMLGRGCYFLFFKRVGEIDGLSEIIGSFSPVLQYRSAEGAIDDLIGKEWNIIVARMREMDWEVTDPGPYPDGWDEDDEVDDDVIGSVLDSAHVQRFLSRNMGSE